MKQRAAWAWLGCASLWAACGDDGTVPVDPTEGTEATSGTEATTGSTTGTPPDPDSTTTGDPSTDGTSSSSGVDSTTAPGIVCGDGMIEGDEVCDGDDLAGETCASQGFDLGGRLACADDCMGLDTRGCTEPVCGNGMVEGRELCDGPDVAGATCQDEGFDNGEITCLGDCTLDLSGCGVCGNFIVNEGEACDAPLLFGQTCLTLGFDSGTLDCQADCLDFDVSGCGICGNLVIDGSEPCDGTEFGGQDCTTLGMGFDSGSVQCNGTCSAILTGGCGTCGNGSIDGAETCDGSLLAGQSCVSQGFDNGVLGCQPDCLAFDASNCGECGNGEIDGGEACDGGLLGGQTCASLGLEGGVLGCSAQCDYDVSGCDVAGVPFGSDGFYYGFSIDPMVLPCDDISGTGVATGLGNEGWQVVPLGFTFEHYQVPFTQVAISPNGTVYFGADANLGLTNSCMPGNTPYVVDDHIVAAFWDDLDPGAAGEVYHQTLGMPGSQRFVVQWDVPNFGGSAVDLMRIQAVLHESGNIEVCYVDTINAADPGNSGAQATAGIQRDPAVGLQYSCNAPNLADGRQLLFVPI